MKIFLGILALVSLAGCSVEKWTEIRVKYGITSLGINTYAYFEVANTLEEAVAGDWTELDVPNLLNLQAVGYDGDYGFTPLYDSKSILAGGQIALAVDVINATGPSDLDPLASGTHEIITINGTEYYSSTFLFADPDTLKNGSRTNLTDGIVGEGLWLRNTSESSGFTKMPDSLDSLLSETLYTWQNCIPNMGIHYYYNTTTESDCQDYYPWFLLGKNGSVSGLGYQLFGDRSKVVQERNWYDIITRLTHTVTVPLANECVYERVDTYGLISLHVYFTPSPWTISCDQETESVSPITVTSLPVTVITSLLKSIFG